MPPLEAMSYGTPVITSNEPPISEICSSGAVLVNPHDIKALADGMKEVISNYELREELKKSGVQKAGEYSWEKAARNQMEYIKMVVSS